MYPNLLITSRDVTHINTLHFKTARIICFLLLTLFTHQLTAQVISGTITDATTKETIPFTNIVFNDGKSGTISDLDGRFSFNSTVAGDSVIFSCIGYDDEKVSIHQLMNQPDISLYPTTFNLSSIDVFPGKNPALEIMERVVANAPRHNPDQTTDYSCIIYHKMTFNFDMPSTPTTQIDSLYHDFIDFNNKSYFILIESVSEKQHIMPDKNLERLISGRVSGFKDPALANIPAQIQPFLFYEKYIHLLNNEYLNPISKAGLNNYVFQLKDTLIDAAGDTLFYISFHPQKGKNFKGIKGAFHIHHPSYALKTVAAETSIDEARMKLSIRQNYQKINDTTWFPLQLESTLEMIPGSSRNAIPYPIIGKGKSYVTAVNLSPTLDPKAFSNIQFKDETSRKDAPEVVNYRYEPLTAKDSSTYQMVDSMGQRYNVDALIKLQKSAIKGYIPWGHINIDIQKLLDFNDYEGFKLGLGLWTSEKISQHFSTGGYFVHGFKDKENKYGVGLNLTPFNDLESKIALSYKDDVNATGLIAFLDEFKALSSESFKRLTFETMDRTEEIAGYGEFRFLNYFKTRLGFKYAEITPQLSYRFFDDPILLQSPFELYEGVVMLKWRHKETFSDTSFGRESKGSSWPAVWINYGYGEGTIDKASFSYNRYEAQMHQDFKLSPNTRTSLRLQATKISGSYPSTLLYSAMGSYKSFGLEIPYTFATMRLNEFAASEFAAAYFRHTIPLWINKPQKFKPEIILSTNVAFGNGPEVVNTLNKGYYESGIFFNNLLRQLFVKYGFSVHYRYGPYRLHKEIDNWAFKLGIEFSL
ncbi:carboxypeptidase-like regulatory domain-containing protein [Marinilabiliaceae bacterium JC017]|nr:carboxypeptidase-like regulatory domain-containing protein [Marinilabiliaceae bacterium JC017]